MKSDFFAIDKNIFSPVGYRLQVQDDLEEKIKLVSDILQKEMLAQGLEYFSNKPVRATLAIEKWTD